MGEPDPNHYTGGGGFRDHDGANESTILDTFEYSTESIPTSGISTYDPGTHPVLDDSLSEVMLYVQDTGTFRDLMEAMLYQSNSAMNTWEGTIGYQSLRNLFEGFVASASNDDHQLELKRISDRYYEQILNTEWAFRIGDSIYVYHPIDPDDISSGLRAQVYDMQGLERTEMGVAQEGCCWWWKQQYCIRQYTSTTRLRLKKWIENYMIGPYVSVGTRLTWQTMVNNRWKDTETGQLHFLLDQWHVLQVGLESGCYAIDREWTNVQVNSYNKKHCEKLWVHRINVLGSFAVKVHDEFGRIHGWTTDFNNDVHGNAWCADDASCWP